MTVNNFNDFTTALLEAGFSMGGSNAENIFSLCAYNYGENYDFGTNIVWHTGDPETDPWEWRMRVLTERDDIAYGKLFFKKSGFITKEWYPYFLAVRRGSMTFEDEYFSGSVSNYSKRIYDVISKNGDLPFHLIKQFAGFGKDEKSAFERALVELQMKMYITMCGRQQKISRCGEEYGWSSTVFCTTERFFGEDVFKKASQITEQEAIMKITAQVYKLNPKAEVKKIMKFIKG